jgi:hypothetical protein
MLLGPLAIFAAALGILPLTGASPLPRSCQGPTVQRDTAVEPVIAVSPADGTLVAAWQQDRYAQPEGGAAALGVSVSHDGGLTWSAASVPGTECRAPRIRSSDPWLAVGPEGTIYLSSIRGTMSPRGRLVTTVAVNVSRDGGRTWAPPVRLVPGGRTLNDKPSITADPTRPGTAYVVWAQRNRIVMSRTADAGATWSPPRAIFEPGRHATANVSTITVLPDGDLIHAFLLLSRHRQRMEVARSPDGRSWSAPVGLGRAGFVGGAARNGVLAAPAVVVSPDGRLYAAWTSRARRRRAQVSFARSTDGGRRWTRPVAAIGPRRTAFAPALAVAGDGTVAVTAYVQSRAAAEYVIARSSDGGRTWSVQRAAPPFSLADSPTAAGRRFVGDYTGLAAADGAFAAAFALGPPAARVGKADVFFRWLLR